jgi:hypothetical protein
MSIADPSTIFRWTSWIFAGSLALLAAALLLLSGAYVVCYWLTAGRLLLGL